MEFKYFRYLFENTDDGIVHSGCVWNEARGEKLNFVYACGMPGHRRRRASDAGEFLRFEGAEEPCHIFVLASFSCHYICVLLRLVAECRVHTVVLPYVPLRQRLSLLQCFVEEGEDMDPRLPEFMMSPYLFLENAGVEHVYQLYGNGEPWQGEAPRDCSGRYFALASQDVMQSVQEMEGHRVPVVKAGYIIEDGWLFYFGCFGHDVGMLWQVEGIMGTSIAMFQGPLSMERMESDGIMIGKPFAREMRCKPCQGWKEKNCLYRCLHDKDYMALHNPAGDGEGNNGCFGTLSTGNVNLGRCLREFFLRFQSVLPQARAVTMPCCGRREYWDRKCLSLPSGEEVRFWICGLARSTSFPVLAEVMVAGARNHVVTVSVDNGYCLSGYLTPLEGTWDMP